MARLAALLGAFTLAAAGAGAADPSVTVVLEGTTTLKAFDIAKECKWDDRARVLRIGCTVYGSYAGRPRPAGAGYGWVWSLPKNAIGVTTQRGSERGTLLLDFGPRGTLTLSLTGKQKRVGTPTAAHAKLRTTGTWKITEGTASFAGSHGSGTYAFTVERAGSPSVFSLARVTLAGRTRA